MSERKLTILTVDDERIIRDLLDSFLRRFGHRSILASSGKEAIRWAERESPDIVLLDIKMPEMDGHQVCRRLREIVSSTSMGIIMITGYGSLDNKERAIESGADDLLEKPLDLYELIYRIRAWTEVQGIANPMERVATYAYKVRQYNNKLKG